MLLTIDVGNTNITLGLYKGNTLVAHWRLATDHARMPDEYGLQFQELLQNAGHTKKELTGICLASVVPQLTARVVQACREYLEKDPFLVDVGFVLPRSCHSLPRASCKLAVSISKKILSL